MNETTNCQFSSAIIYGIEDCPPFKEAFFAALQHFNSFPNSVFAQNNGMIQLTGVASRYVGYVLIHVKE